MSRRRVSPAAMGSSYRHLFVRAEWWRVATAAFTHGGLFHLTFNITALWVCRRMEADLGSWGYLLASAHLVILAEVFEKILLHTLLMTGRFVDEISIGYSGVIFAWMTVISLNPEPSAQFDGLALGGFAYVLFNLLAMRFLVRGSSFTGHLAGILAGLIFSAGGLEFARQRFWGTGVAVWALAIFFGRYRVNTGKGQKRLGKRRTSQRQGVLTGGVLLKQTQEPYEHPQAWFSEPKELQVSIGWGCLAALLWSPYRSASALGSSSRSCRSRDSPCGRKQRAALPHTLKANRQPGRSGLETCRR
ncbi:unnamed protein product [Ascophyllum nodosum]